MNKIVCITGASSGFGEATARRFAAAGYDLIITGRRTDKLEKLQQELEKPGIVKVFVITLDVRDRDAVAKAFDALPENWKAIGILVNNAGLAAGRETFDTASLDDWDNMIDTNVKGLLYVTRAVLPFMIPKKSGHIINIGSIAGKQVYPKGNVYCATKFAVGALSQSMRIDLAPHRIKVTVVEPGAAETEFSLVRLKQDSAEAKKVYEGYKPLVAEDIAEIIFYVASMPGHVCINELEVTPLAQANAYITAKDNA